MNPHKHSFFTEHIKKNEKWKKKIKIENYYKKLWK